MGDMQNEQTVIDAILGNIDAWLDEVHRDDMSADLGFDVVNTTVSRLREDLAIAARVRACVDEGYFVRFPEEHPTLGHGAEFPGHLLAWLLNGDTPRVLFTRYYRDDVEITYDEFMAALNGDTP